MSEGSVVRGVGVSYRYGRKRVLENLEIAFGTGISGLVGPNGAGKSTLLNLTATLTKPGSGSLEVLGYSTSDSAPLREIRRRIGFLPQDFGYQPAFTVREAIEYAAWLKKAPAAKLSELTTAAIDAVDLGEQRNTKLKALSGGMLRRAGIAQAIVHRPQLVILDEPTIGLDPQQRIGLRKLLRDIARDASVIVSTHLIEDVGAICDDVVVFARGHVAFQDSPTALEQAGGDDDIGDTALERGYSAVLAGFDRDRHAHARRGATT